MNSFASIVSRFENKCNVSYEMNLKPSSLLASIYSLEVAFFATAASRERKAAFRTNTHKFPLEEKKKAMSLNRPDV